MSKSKKTLIAIIFIFFISSLTFLVPVSAVNVEPETHLSGFDIYGINIVMIDSNGDLIPTSSMVAVGSGGTSATGFPNSVEVRCARTDGYNFSLNNDYHVLVYMSAIDDALLNNNYYTVGTMNLAFYKSLASPAGGEKAYRYDTSNESSVSVPQQATVNIGSLSNSVGNFHNYTFNFNDSKLGYSYDRYTLNFKIRFKQENNTITFRFHKFDFRTLSPNEYVQEKEKNEVQGSGNNSIDGITGVLPNTDTNGVINSFKTLTTSMIHNNTACKMEFPAIVIPELTVQGVSFGPFTLSEKKEIDFEQAFTLIPEKIILLIQSLCTAGLIIFCFKELYSHLAFIFTTKGGASSE